MHFAISNFPKESAKAVWLIIATGVVLRIVLFATNPPNNGYDDYLEPVALTAENQLTLRRRLAPNECWECYQPPVYLEAAGATLNVTRIMGLDFWWRWKAVQSISLLASIGALFFGTAFLIKSELISHRGQIVAIALLAYTPRCIFTSSFVSNDALLDFFVSVSTYGFLVSWRSPSIKNYVLLAASVATAAWVKQSGLICVVYLVTLLIRDGSLRKSDNGNRVLLGKSILLLAIFLSLTDEAIRSAQTGTFLASNQNFFNWAVNQPPGDASLSMTLLPSIRPYLLDPWLDLNSVDSLVTQLAARSWFDFEPRFIARGGTFMALIGVAAISVGTLFLAGAIRGIVRMTYQGIRTKSLMILSITCVGTAFLLTPAVQFFRLPYFSSMKFLFCEPAMPILALASCIAVWPPQNRFSISGKVSIKILVLALSALSTLIIASAAIRTNNFETAEISGPMWQFPPLRQ